MAKKPKKKKTKKARRLKEDDTGGTSTGSPDDRSSPSPVVSLVGVIVVIVAAAVAAYYVEFGKIHTVSVTPINQEKLDVFIEWLETNHENYPTAWIDKVELVETNSPKGRAVHVKRRAKIGEPLILIPMNFVITSDRAKNSPLGQEVIDNEIDVFSLDELYITLFLLQEMNDPDSFWKPYLDVLPQNFDHFPTFFDESDLDLLKNTWAEYQIHVFNDSAWNEFEGLQALESFTWSFEEYLKARTLVLSRMSVFQLDADIYTYGLVPLLDMFNHNTSFPNETINWMFDPSRHSISVFALQQTPRKTEAMVNYGRRSLAVYLSQYGFVHEDMVKNERNRAMLELEVPEELRDEDFSDPTISLTLAPTLDSQESVIMFSAIRRLTMPPDHRQQYLSLYESTTRTGVEPAGTDHELAALKMFSELVRNRLKSYGTSYEEDLESARKAPEFSNRRHALITRAAEKLILESYLDVEDVIGKLLQLETPKELSLILEENVGNPAFEKYGDYIQNIVDPLLRQEEQRRIARLREEEHRKEMGEEEEQEEVEESDGSEGTEGDGDDGDDGEGTDDEDGESSSSGDVQRGDEKQNEENVDEGAEGEIKEPESVEGAGDKDGEVAEDKTDGDENVDEEEGSEEKRMEEEEEQEPEPVDSGVDDEPNDATKTDENIDDQPDSDVQPNSDSDDQPDSNENEIEKENTQQDEDTTKTENVDQQQQQQGENLDDNDDETN